jgi:hypothetical protein
MMKPWLEALAMPVPPSPHPKHRPPLQPLRETLQADQLAETSMARGNAQEPRTMTSMTAQQILDREFLELRAKLLELAASFDRLERAQGSTADDPRRQKLEMGLRVLLSSEGDRAERIQLIFSREYANDWQSRFQLKSEPS